MLYLILVISPINKKPFKFLCCLQEVLHPTANLADPGCLAVWNAFLTVARVATVPVEVLMCVCQFDIYVTARFATSSPFRSRPAGFEAGWPALKPAAPYTE